MVAAAVTGIEGEESGSRTLYRYLGEPLLLGQGPVPPFAVYEQPRTLSLVFSTFNVAVKVDETPERVDSFGLVLRPDEDKRAHCTFFQSALSGDNAGGAVASPGGSLAPHCRIDVVLPGALNRTFDILRAGIYEDMKSSRLEIVLPKKQALRMQLHEIGGV